MKKKRTSRMIIIGLCAVVFVFISMVSYNNYVHKSLWNQTVDDILEATSQEEKAFQIYLRKEITNSRNVVTYLLENENKSKLNIEQQLASFSKKQESEYLFLDIEKNRYYSKNQVKSIKGSVFEKLLETQDEEGILPPYFNEESGIKMVGTYAKSEYKGKKGIIVKETQASFIAKNFSLSFFNDLGFSYIVDSSGEILLRSNHSNANRTFKNLYELIDLSGNDKDIIQSFQDALKDNKKGIARFSYNNESNVFCYVPIQGSNDWFIISIIPNAVIMKQANHIIISTMILCGGIILAIALVLMLYLKALYRHKKELEQQAYYDKLTQLYSYQRFKTLAENILKTAQDCSILYLDIADFKIINEMYGYYEGDILLKQLADILRELIGDYGILCRINADKFLLMIHSQDKDKLKALHEEINHRIQKSSNTHEKRRNIIIRAGICCCEAQMKQHSMDGWIDCSLLALNNVKHSTQSTYSFYSLDMHDQMIKKAEIEDKMEDALMQKEFKCFLQPKYDVSGQQLLGAEALVRWIPEESAIIMPKDFIPIFEMNGFILKLDEFIFEEVCRYLSERMQRKLSVVPISINISRLHFYQDDFIERYTKIKDTYQIPDQLLELEITENILVDNLEQVHAVVVQLQKNGFTCSIDDFGSGYSSLNVLKDLPFDTLKLDGVFLRNSYDVKRSQEIIRSVVEMAKRVHLKTVAEGVESEEQLAFLVSVHCDMIQGYIFAKPMPLHEFDLRMP